MTRVGEQDLLYFKVILSLLPSRPPHLGSLECREVSKSFKNDRGRCTTNPYPLFTLDLPQVQRNRQPLSRVGFQHPVALSDVSEHDSRPHTPQLV